ncbi:hypothetical protein [Devosia sp. A449]
MKSNWVIFGFVAVELLLLGILIGSLTVTGAPADAPHGGIDYWAYRYQTLIAGVAAVMAAIASIGMIQKQIKAAQYHHAAVIFEGKLKEIDALEGIVSYCKQLGYERAGAFKNGRDLTTPDLNLTYRATMFTPFSVSAAFSRLCDHVATYNQSDRKTVAMYGGDESGETEHGMRCSLLFGLASVIGHSASDHIEQLQALAPTASPNLSTTRNSAGLR